MKKLFLLLLILPLQLFAQAISVSDSAGKNVRPKYYELGAGLNISSFRDFATSPLVYSGIAGQFILGIIRRDEQIESNFGFRFSSGIYLSPENTSERTTSNSQYYFRKLFPSVSDKISLVSEMEFQSWWQNRSDRKYQAKFKPA